VGIPGTVVCRFGQIITEFCDNPLLCDNDDDEEVDLDHNDLPDPVAEMMLCMQRHIDRLENRIEILEAEQKNEELKQCDNEGL